MMLWKSIHIDLWISSNSYFVVGTGQNHSREIGHLVQEGGRRVPVRLSRRQREALLMVAIVYEMINQCYWGSYCQVCLISNKIAVISGQISVRPSLLLHYSAQTQTWQ